MSSDYLHMVTPDLGTATKHAINYLTNARKTYPEAKLALVLDIDDTVLKADGYKRQQVLAQMKTLFETARKLNYDVFFITARPDEGTNFSFTKQQLQRTGFGDFKQLFLMPPKLREKGQFSAFKYLIRHKIEQEGYRIVLNCGDSFHDLLVLPDVSAHPKAKTVYTTLSKIPDHNYILFSPPENVWLCLKMAAPAPRQT